VPNQVQIGAPAAPTELTVRQPMVQVRPTWSDDWGVIDYLEPLTWEQALAPTVTQARFRWAYGTITRPDAAEAVYAPGLDEMIGWFVRIIRQPAAQGQPATVLWTGQISASADHVGGDDIGGEPTGDEVVTARGLESILARQDVCQSHVEGVADALTIIDTLLPFNLRHRNGNSLMGNRSTAKVAGAYLFSADGELWSARDVAEYLLARFSPADMPFTLAGQLDNLDLVVRTFRGTWPTLFHALNAVIDRRRGLCWWVDASGGDPQVRVASVFDEPAAAGGSQVAPNTDLIDVVTTGAGSTARSVTIDRTLDAHYSRIEVRGEPIVICASVAVDGGTLAAGWSAAQQSAYEAGASAIQGYADLDTAVKAVRNDQARARDIYRPVFCRFAVPAAWAFTDRNGRNVAPSPRLDGTLDTAVNAGGFCHGKSFLRQLPLQVGRTYHTAAAPVLADASAGDEFVPPLVVARVPVSDEHAPYLPLDRLSECIPGAPSMPIRTLDGELGFEVTARPNYLLALNHWSGEPGTWPPQIDYDTIVATMAWESDQHVNCQVALPAAGNCPVARTLLIHVPDAELWWMPAGTVTDVSDSGDLLVTPADMVLRDDSEKLRIVAALARSWYGRVRRAVTVEMADLAAEWRPGAIVRQLHAAGRWYQIGTIVSRVRWDASSATTTVQTDFAELDFVAAAGVRP